MRSTARIAFVATTLVASALCDCESYGLDFQNGGTYFQNSLSTDPFTALQEFEGCQNDTAYNVLVDPQGDQSECSNTPLTPDDTPETVTCTDWPKDKLYTGDWSLLIISNNGDAEPIAYQRDFSLTVGPQSTVTLPQSTITGGSAGTSTITPAPTTVTVTVGFIQFTQTVVSTTAATTTTVVPASCAIATKSSSKDPLATIVPSILGELNAVASSVISGNKNKRAEPTPRPLRFTRAVAEKRDLDDPADKEDFVRARRDTLAKIAKRAPDAPVVTSTPVPAYVPSTITIPAKTSSRTSYIPFTITSETITSTSTTTETITTTSSGAASSCSASGGILI